MEGKRRYISPVECRKGIGTDDSAREKNVNYLLSLPKVLVSCQAVRDGAKPQLVERNMAEQINSSFTPLM